MPASFATGLADAGVNVQQAMALAGHRTASTHMRYVKITEVLEVPLAALPKLQKAQAVPFALRPASEPSVFSAHPVGFEPTTLGFEVLKKLSGHVRHVRDA